MPGAIGLHLSFDEHGREIEILDVIRVDEDKYRIEETPIFNPAVTMGDVIRVREEHGIYYYVETVEKSPFRRMAWLLSKETVISAEIAAVKERITVSGGKWEQIFGGLFVVHMPKSSVIDVETEMNRLIERFER